MGPAPEGLKDTQAKGRTFNALKNGLTDLGAPVPWTLDRIHSTQKFHQLLINYLGGFVLHPVAFSPSAFPQMKKEG